jgi:glycosyltransferase involved in cell wall biosynthesis
LDFSLEQISLVSEKHCLDVVIVLIEGETDQTVFATKKIIKSGIYKWSDIRDKVNDTCVFDAYFEYCRSVNFLVFKKNYGINTVLLNFKLLYLMLKGGYSFIHFDDISPRIFSALFAYSKTIILNLHDPVPHTGEFKKSDKFFRQLFFFKVHKFCLYSNYSAELFRAKFNNFKDRIVVLNLPIYFSYRRISLSQCSQLKSCLTGDKLILFFGRISEYKGLPFLVDSFKQFTCRADNLHLVIAGSGKVDDRLSKLINANDHITFINRFISSSELVFLLRNCDLVVCPYTDATQSGVIMTAMALNRPVVASNVGSFEEYIIEGQNGQLYMQGDFKDFSRAIFLGLNTLYEVSGATTSNEHLTASYLSVYN